MTEVVIGIFVGGASRRLGGIPKGLLKAPESSETLIARLLRVCGKAAPDASICLVGSSRAYAAFALPELADDPPEVGPIGGLRSLLLRAEADHARVALALACDLPFIDEAILEKLLGPVLAGARVPLVDGHFQPLAAAYCPSAALRAVNRSLALGKHALMQVLEELGPELDRLELDAAGGAALRDWDTPEDIIG